MAPSPGALREMVGLQSAHASTECMRSSGSPVCSVAVARMVVLISLPSGLTAMAFRTVARVLTATLINHLQTALLKVVHPGWTQSLPMDQTAHYLQCPVLWKEISANLENVPEFSMQRLALVGSLSEFSCFSFLLGVASHTYHSLKNLHLSQHFQDTSAERSLRLKRLIQASIAFIRTTV